MKNNIVQLEKMRFRHLSKSKLKEEYQMSSENIDKVDYSTYSLTKLKELKRELKCIEIFSKSLNVSFISLIALFVAIYSIFFTYTNNVADTFSDFSLNSKIMRNKLEFYTVIDEKVNDIDEFFIEIDDQELKKEIENFVQYFKMNRANLAFNDEEYKTAVRMLDSISLKNDYNIDLRNYIYDLKILLVELSNLDDFIKNENVISEIESINETMDRMTSSFKYLLIALVTVYVLICRIQNYEDASSSLIDKQMNKVDYYIEHLSQLVDEDTYLIKVKQI